MTTNQTSGMTEKSTEKTKKSPLYSKVIGPSTINNPTENDFEMCRKAVANGVLRYVTFNYEKGTQEETPHIQIFAQSKEKMRMKSWQKALGGRVGGIIATRSVPDAIDYCQGYKTGTKRTERKEGSQEHDPEKNIIGYEEYGELSYTGKRTDLEHAIEQIQEGTSINQLIETMPGTVSNAYNMLRDYHRDTRTKRAKQTVLEQEFTDIKWRGWQQQILNLIETKPDPRKVHWYWESDGNYGKSTLTRYLAATDKAYIPDVGKMADIYHGYNLEPVIIFDIPRSKIEYMDHLYAVIEGFLNGKFFSSKYNSQTHVFPRPHVIVFANDPPKEYDDKGKLTLSQDRWNVTQLVQVHTHDRYTPDNHFN